MGPRAGLDGYGKSRLLTGIRFPDSPARILTELSRLLLMNWPYLELSAVQYVSSRPTFYGDLCLSDMD